MSKKILDVIDPYEEKDSLDERIEKEPVASKYWMFLAFSIIGLMIAFILNVLTFFGKQETPPADLYSVVKKDGKLDESTIKLVRITLPSSHNTLKNVTSWIKEAIGETYSFGFLDYEKKVEKVRPYFTDAGYAGYTSALKNAGIEQTVVGKKLEISIVPLKEPILIDSGMFQEMEFWRFKTPVLVSYYGGKETIREKYYLEMLIRKVPSYVNPKSLAIHEYIITRM